MVNLSDLAFKIEGGFPEHLCEDLIAYYEENSERACNEFSSNVYTNKAEVSSFTCVYPDNDTASQICEEVFEYALDEWCQHLHHYQAFSTAELYLMARNPLHYRIMKYVEGQSIHAHTDVSNAGIGATVRASCTVNLCDTYEGGDFSFFNGNHTVSLGKGDILIFPADTFWVHEVKPVTSGVRYCINGFLGP